MKGEKPTIPKGTRDFGPNKMLKRQFILDTIKKVFEKESSILTVVIVLSLIIVIGAFTKVFGGLSELRESFNVVSIITNPYVLGALAILLIGAFAARHLTELKTD